MSDMPAPPSLPQRRGGMRRAAGEAGVIKTNDDAQSTKLSCASLGYFTDVVLPLLHKSLPSRKPPIINRGTWARHAVMRQVTHDFITVCTQQHSGSTDSQPAVAAEAAPAAAAATAPSESPGSSRGWVSPVCQVVALGAGTDSTWFNLQHQAWELLPAARFIELDYQEVVSKKARTVLSTPQLLALLPDGTTAATAPGVTQTHPADPTAAAAAAGVVPPAQQLSPSQAPDAAMTAPGGLLPFQKSPQQQAGSSSSSHHPAVIWTKQQPHPAGKSAAGTSIPDQLDGTNLQQLRSSQECPADPGALHDSTNPPTHTPHIQQQLQHPQLQDNNHRLQPDTCSSSSSSNTSSIELYGPCPPASVLHHVQELSGRQYSLVAADLRDTKQLKAALQRAGFNPQLPTLYLCECVLIYLEPAEAQAVLAATAAMAAEAGAAAAVAIYEQTRPDDAFGSTMISNLEARGCPLRSVLVVPTPASQVQRLTSTGWTSAAAADMAAIYHTGGTSSSRSFGTMPAPGGSMAGVVQQLAVGNGSGGMGFVRGWLRPCWQAERVRVERLELLDEVEEWKLLQEHYCLALGVLERGSSWLSQALQLDQLAALST